MIVARKEAVEEKLHEAENLQQKANEQMVFYEQKRVELDRKRDEFLKEARDEADEVKKKMLDDIAAEGEVLRRRFATLLANEGDQLRQSFQASLIKQVCGMSATLIREVAGRSLEDGLIDGFEKAIVREEIKSPDNVKPPITVKLSFLPDDDQRLRLDGLVEKLLGRSLPADQVRYIHEPSLVLGVEIDYEQAVITWSAESHLKTLEDDALAIVDKSTNSVTSEVVSDA